MAHKNELHEQKGDDVEGMLRTWYTQGLAEVRENRKFVKSKVFRRSYVYYQMLVVCAAFRLLVASLVEA